jgi:flagellar biosynthesis protein FlhF
VPIRTLVGSNVAVLLKQAQAAIGADAVILHVRRIRTPAGVQFEVAAADPASAARGDLIARGAPIPALELMVPAQPARGPLVIALLGPTGAGKTTTLAKLATHPRIFGSRRVGLIGLDSYRIGAIEQLRTYAEIARLPAEIVYGVEDLDRARQRLADCEVWLVDTPGRSPRHRHDREFTAELLQQLAPQEIHLTIPAGTPSHLARSAIREHRVPAVTHLLVTKCDEAPDEAGVFELALDLGLPVRWATDGQDVPFDLRSASEMMTAVRIGQQGGRRAREAVA